MSDQNSNPSPSLIGDIGGLGKLADSKLINSTYEDVASGPLKEMGEGLADVVAGLRLFTAPLMIMATWHKKLQRYCEEVLSNVPEERRIEAAPEVVGQVLQSLTFVTDGNPLKEMYLNLLARAIDRDRQGEAHPAFARIIDQLSPDEALILSHVKHAILHGRRIDGKDDLGLPNLVGLHLPNMMREVAQV